MYWATVLLLIFTLIKGSVGMGAQRWVNLGFIKFQSSDLAKLFFPMFLSYYFLFLFCYSHKVYPHVRFWL